MPLATHPAPGCRPAFRPVPAPGAPWAGAGATPSYLTRDPRRPVRLGYVLRRGCRAPARKVLGRRVRYVIGCEPGQVNGRRWRRG